MARFFSFAILLLAMVASALAMHRVVPKPVLSSHDVAVKKYQLTVSGASCGAPKLNLICQAGQKPEEAELKKVVQSVFLNGQNNIVNIALDEITVKKADLGASRA